MKFPIKHKLTGDVLFEAELGAEFEARDDRVRLGAAVKLAVRAGAHLRDANLGGADLSDAHLYGADLGGAHLGGANLGDANLGDANLGGADLRGANLYGADLGGANLYGANLRRANLRRANLYDADLGGANLYGADLGGAKAIIFAGYPDGWTTYGWLRDDYLSIRVGCREKRLDEAREYWAGKDDRREVLAAVEYIKVVAEIRGWPVEEAREAA